MTLPSRGRFEDPGFRRHGPWGLWLLFACVVLGGSAYYSWLAPVGDWTNQISGEPVWSESDPGSYYVASAHELAWGEQPLFVGHPGATLVPLLWGVQSALHLAFGEQASFTRFTAQHLATVFWASKLLVTVLHLLSFVALYAVTKQLVRDARAATLAVLGYASSFPVLYFLSRISVEPLMVLCFLLSFLAIWRYQDLALERRTAAALGCVALAAGLSVSGAMTKLNFLGPLPFFLALYALAGRDRRGGAIDVRTRALALVSFAVAGGGAFALYSQVIDWRDFFAIWQGIAAKPISTQWELRDFLPGRGARRIFALVELGFCGFALASWALFVRRGRVRERTLWFSGFALFSVIVWGYRVALEGHLLPFHYFFIAQAALAVFFGYGSVRAAARLGLPLTGARALGVALLWIGVIHGLGAGVVHASRRHDAAMYEQTRPVFEQLRALGPREHVGVIRRWGGTGALSDGGISLHGMRFPFYDTRDSVLVTEFARLFEFVEPGSPAADAPRIFVPALAGELVLPRSPASDVR